MPKLRPKWLAYAQLMRLPNLFTAVADPLAGWFIVGATGSSLLLVGASACLYTAGIVLNDCFDYRQDCQERPERPLPRGVIGLRTAWTLGAALLVAGVALGGFAAIPLAVLILFYDAVARRIAWLGPVTLGGCRALNIALGLGGFVPVTAPVVLGIYVAGLSVIARHEEARPELRRLVKRLLQGIIVVDAALVFAFTGDWQAAALVLSLLVPALALGKILPMT